MIVLVAGIPGSGKTTLCEKLDGIATVDMDDIFQEYSIKYFKHADYYLRAKDSAFKYIDETCEHYKKTGKLIVFLTQNDETIKKIMQHADIKYLIQVDDYQEVYKRITLRYMKDYVTKIGEIKRECKKNKGKKLTSTIIIKYGIHIPPQSSYHRWEFFNTLFNKEQAKDAIVLPVDKIYNAIKKHHKA